jgi:hypothetical protein
MKRGPHKASPMIVNNRIAGTRITVWDVLHYLETGWSRSEISERAGEAVTAVLVPLCVERFMEQADAAAKLAEFQRSASWQHSQLIEKGGWATATGSNSPNSAVAKACAQQLVNRKT